MINGVPAVWVFGSGWYKHPSPIAVSPILNGTPVSPNANGITVYPNAIGISTSSPPSPNGSPGGFSFAPAFVNSPPMVVLAPDDSRPKCDCGGEKLKTTHYDWCSITKGQS